MSTVALDHKAHGAEAVSASGAIATAALAGALSSAAFVAGFVFVPSQSFREGVLTPYSIVNNVVTTLAFAALAMAVPTLGRVLDVPRWALYLSAAAFAAVAAMSWSLATLAPDMAKFVTDSEFDEFTAYLILFPLPKMILGLVGFSVLGVSGWRRRAIPRGAAAVLILAGIASLWWAYPPGALLGALAFAWIVKTVEAASRDQATQARPGEPLARHDRLAEGLGTVETATLGAFRSVLTAIRRVHRAPRLIGMNVRTAISIVTIGAAVLVGAPATTSTASTTSGNNGAIVFTLELPDSQQLQVLDPVTGSVRTLTHRQGVDAFNADWSPSGRRLVFEANVKDRVFIQMVRADGTHRRTLRPGLSGFLSNPAFVPHSNLIVFERDVPRTDDDSLWVMRRDGTHPRRLTTNPFAGQGGDTDPNVSPDGRLVSFVRISVEGDQQALYSVQLDGSRLRRLIPYAADVAVKHDWSPDGKHIVVSLNANEGSRPHASANVAILRPDGSHLRRLTHFKGRKINALVGGFSPNGRWIVYRVETGDGEPTLADGRYALMKVSPQSGEQMLVAAIDGRPRNIDWGAAS